MFLNSILKHTGDTCNIGGVSERWTGAYTGSTTYCVCFCTVIIMNTSTAKMYTWKHTNAYQSKVMLMMYFRNVALINCRTPVIYFIMFKHSWKLSLFLHYYYNDLVYKYISICKTIGNKVFPIHVWKLATLFANLKQIHF